MALSALGLFRVEILVRFGKQGFDALAISAVDGDTDAGGETRRFIVVGHDFADTVGQAVGLGLLRFWENEGEFVAAIASSGRDGPAVKAEDSGEAPDGQAADDKDVTDVDVYE